MNQRRAEPLSRLGKIARAQMSAKFGLLVVCMVGLAGAVAASALMAQEESPPQGGSSGIDCQREMLVAVLAAHQEQATLDALASSDFGIVGIQSTDDDTYVVTVQTTNRGTGSVATRTYRVEASRRCRVFVEPE
jgi:uncharacterized membrane protein YeaQ/YmgE (transglycosylase-associated protein family)